MNTAQLFTNRMQSSWQRAIQIVRVIASGGGTPLIIGILLISLYYGYQRFLAWLPAEFPVVWLLAFILSLFLTSSRLRTWIKPPDLVFLLPLESKMDSYFRASIRYSYMIHLIHLSLILLLFYPLYRVRLGETSDFAFIWILLALLQIGNVYLQWFEVRRISFYPASQARLLILIRWLLNLTISFFMLQQSWWLLGLTIVFFLVLTWYLYQTTPKLPYPWALLRDQEQQTLARYYATARWFIDLPEVATEIKPRTWLIRLMEHLFPKQKALPYLYWRSFFRNSELFPIYIRILVWVIWMIALFPTLWVITIILLLSLWMFGIQLPSIANPRYYPVWLRIYPISDQERRQSFTQMSMILLSILTALIILVTMLLHFLPIQLTIVLGLVGFLFSYLLSYFYIPRKLNEIK